MALCRMKMANICGTSQTISRLSQQYREHQIKTTDANAYMSGFVCQQAHCQSFIRNKMLRGWKIIQNLDDEMMGRKRITNNCNQLNSTQHHEPKCYFAQRCSVDRIKLQQQQLKFQVLPQKKKKKKRKAKEEQTDVYGE